MAFCTNCGSAFDDNSDFCPYCGARICVQNDQQPQPQPQYQQPQPQYQYQQYQQPQYQQPPYQQPQPQFQQPYVPFQPQITYYVKPKIPGRGYGIASMVLGIIGIVYSVVALLISIVSDDVYYGFSYARSSVITTCIIYSSLAILAIIFGIVSIAKGYKRGQSISGLILGSCALLIIIIAIIIAAVS